MKAMIVIFALVFIFIISACVSYVYAYKDGEVEGAFKFKEEFENYVNEHQFAEETKNELLNELDYILKNIEG